MDDGSYLYAVRTPGPAIVLVLEGKQPVRAILPTEPDDVALSLHGIPQNVWAAIQVALFSELRAHGIEPPALKGEPEADEE
jgi:hypothetical protein